MQLEITFSYPEPYLPSKRHRKLRYRLVEVTTPFKLTSISSENFPTAFITRDFSNAQDDTEGPYISEITKTYKTFNGKLYRLLYKFEDTKYIKEFMQKQTMDVIFSLSEHNHPELTKDASIASIQSRFDLYLIVDDNEIWLEASEPVYYVGYSYTGMGKSVLRLAIRPHGEMLLQDCFNALQKEQAKANCMERVETYDGPIGLNGHIEVLMPEMVQCDPQAEFMVSILST